MSNCLIFLLELKELLKLHGHHGQGEGGVLTVDETTIMKGALDMKDKTCQVRSALSPHIRKRMSNSII